MRGGPGRYTVELAKLGYDIILIDLTQKQLEIAKRQIKNAEVQYNVKNILQCSIDDLSIFKNNTFDAILCLGGTLSHIVKKEQRERAIEELIRVMKHNALIFISVIGKLSVLISGLVRYPDEMKIDNIYSEVLDTGIYKGRHDFIPCYCYMPDELESSFNKRGVKVLEKIGLEGLATFHQKEINMLQKKYPKAWANWLELHLKTCNHPSVVGMSEHFMIICKKK